MNKLRKKHNRYRILKTISYLLGFPLLIAMVCYGSLSFWKGEAFSNTWWYGIAIVGAMWLIVTLLQIVFSAGAKSRNARAVFTVIISVVLILGGAVGFDIYAEKKIETISKDYAGYNVNIDPYKYQINHYVNWTKRGSLTDKYNDKIAEFCYIYNIDAFSSCFSDEKNADGSLVTYDKKKDVYLSPNGMYADGYVFGVDQAIDILITYHEYQAKHSDADKRLQAELDALEVNSEWTKYKQSREYQDQYGVGGEAAKLMVTAVTLDAMIAKISGGLDEVLGNSLISGIVNSLIGGTGLTVDDLMGLSLEKVYDLIVGMDLLDTVAGFIGVEFTEAMTDDEKEALFMDGLFELLEVFSFYQSPVTKPKFDFIQDEELKAYAYANYYATVHGAEIGSVLIGDQIGAVTMSSPGLPASAGFTLDELYQLRAQNEYTREFYPLFAARRYLYIFAGVIAMTTLLYYHWSKKEKETFGIILKAAKAGGMR